MQTRLPLKEQLERLAEERAGHPDPSAIEGGERIAYLLHALNGMPQRITIAKLLMAQGLRPPQAHATITRLAETLLSPIYDRPAVTVALPNVQDPAMLEKQLAELGVRAERRRPPEVDVRGVREGYGLTQEEFALRFGLDLATLRNWEQGRTRPDGPARVLLKVIEQHPRAVEDALS
jgi:DNA-binding transcriptional regulator YiaG